MYGDGTTSDRVRSSIGMPLSLSSLFLSAMFAAVPHADAICKELLPPATSTKPIQIWSSRSAHLPTMPKPTTCSAAPIS